MELMLMAVIPKKSSRLMTMTPLFDSSDTLVIGVQFILKSGVASEVYGSPIARYEEFIFEGQHPGSKLVGVHGQYAGVIDRLGFTFATEEKPGWNECLNTGSCARIIRKLTGSLDETRNNDAIPQPQQQPQQHAPIEAEAEVIIEGTDGVPIVPITIVPNDVYAEAIPNGISQRRIVQTKQQQFFISVSHAQF